MERIAKKGKPLFLSTGMSYLSEVKQALKTIYKFNREVVLLQCTANYPIQDFEVNLEVINTYRNNFDILLGYSDHSQGIGAAPFAIPMGAKVIEKHFTINKYDDGPDHSASLSPDELNDFVTTIRRVDTFMGSGKKEPTLSEQNTRKSLQKCLVARDDIKKGDLFTRDNLVAKRTGGAGISPIKVHEIYGLKSVKNYKKNQIIEN